MLWLYRLVFLPIALISAPYYGWRMRRRGGYGAHFSQRFGAAPALPAKRPGVKRVWLQAVSVGELLAVAPLIEAWKNDPAVELYLSTTTSTGYALAAERYHTKGAVAALGYFPLDFWPCSARAWRAIQPDLVVLTEGERWPEHLHQAARRGVPAVAVNARLSDRSFRRMRRLGPLARLLVRGLTRVLAASAGDAERFAAFGVPAERIAVTGNLKLDVALPEVGPGAEETLRRELGLGASKILLGASTWPGEEAALLAAWRALRAAPAGAGGDWKLLLVPRHAERRAELEALLAAGGHAYHLRSRGAADGPVEIVLADTTGELARLLALAEMVFVGKTLPPHTEGQTPVEAAARGKPVLFGPGTANFRVIAQELVACGAARRVADAAELVEGLRLLAADPVARAAAGAAGLRWHAASRGAAERTRAALAEILERRN
jgi:3-deoxy-D-manno-octulosonic-acid transferase